MCMLWATNARSMLQASVRPTSFCASVRDLRGSPHALNPAKVAGACLLVAMKSCAKFCKQFFVQRGGGTS
jgi:hypothetical protein